ncbi:hypothetical protein BDZ85DRAFT_283871 [Elsinoe ampelina]|uniref:C2H2-type domain-containing protein n=1 Tax=Elsinoe ampelina TaxID=302913 RepID=A0A6A6G6D1_9PEZI|nr:hypothetical protein BDZ85DRAFT_283871 [Elsinoe ampelina]
MPPAPSSTTVEHAIRAADKARLRAVLLAVINLPEAKAFAERQLLVPASPSGTQPTASKRKRYEHCINCEEEFDVNFNDEEACRWHDGELEVDWDGDFWADHDEDCHGTIDTEDMREENPEGFKWDCCDEPGDAEGCQVGEHEGGGEAREGKRRG